MNILLTGGTGFIGKPLALELLKQGHTLYILTRSIPNAEQIFAEAIARYQGCLFFHDNLSGLGNNILIEAVINLAGESVTKRLWTTGNKHKLWNSRVQLTLDLALWIRECATPPKVLISGSAIGYYGDQKNSPVFEETRGKSSFSHELCRHWEQAALNATRYGCRVCCLRMGIVLAEDGGLIQKLRPMCKLGAGLLFGNGEQWQPWIHRDDLIQIIITALEDDAYFSAVNAVAPTPTTHKELSQAVGKRIGQPFWLRLPRWLVFPILGEMSQLFFNSAKAMPNRLNEFGYRFRYPKLSDALNSIFSETPEKRSGKAPT